MTADGNDVGTLPQTTRRDFSGVGYDEAMRRAGALVPTLRERAQRSEDARVLLDSDIVIEILRGRASIADGLAAAEIQGIPTYCCAITWAEIGAGLRPGEEAATEDFFQARGEVVIDAATGRRAGAYLSRYSRSHEVEMADALIARRREHGGPPALDARSKALPHGGPPALQSAPHMTLASRRRTWPR